MVVIWLGRLHVFCISSKMYKQMYKKYQKNSVRIVLFFYIVYAQYCIENI